MITLFDLADVLLKKDQGEDAGALVEAALDATRDLDSDDRGRVMAVSRGADIYARLGQSERAALLREQLPAK